MTDIRKLLTIVDELPAFEGQSMLLEHLSSASVCEATALRLDASTGKALQMKYMHKHLCYALYWARVSEECVDIEPQIVALATYAYNESLKWC